MGPRVPIPQLVPKVPKEEEGDKRNEVQKCSKIHEGPAKIDKYLKDLYKAVAPDHRICRM
jgi:hypothetical protein